MQRGSWDHNRSKTLSKKSKPVFKRSYIGMIWVHQNMMITQADTYHPFLWAKLIETNYMIHIMIAHWDIIPPVEWAKFIEKGHRITVHCNSWHIYSPIRKAHRGIRYNHSPLKQLGHNPMRKTHRGTSYEHSPLRQLALNPMRKEHRETS